MKIKNLTLKNFAKVSEVSVNFDAKLTYLIGNNGAGKTTVGLNGVFFVFEGLAQKGSGLIAERFRFIGPHGKSAKGEITLYDEAEGVEIKISRKLLKNKTELKIEASDGRQLDQAWLSSIFNAFLIDPMGFSKLTGKAQALAFGADTAKFDIQKKELYNERLLIGRDVERLQGVVDTAIKDGVKKVEAVDVKGLMQKLDKRREVNENNRIERESLKDFEVDLEGHRDGLKGFEDQLKKMEKAVVEKKAVIKTKEAELYKMVEVVTKHEPADEQEVKDQIESAQEINQKATAYQQYCENDAAWDEKRQDYESKNFEIKKTETERTEYLKSLNLPWPNITITDEGEFRLNDKPFCSPYFSTGEILKFGARIGSKLKDGLKYVFIPNSESLDEKNRETLFKTLNKDGFQIICEYVSTEKIPGENCILLKELKVVESYDESATDSKTLS